MASFPVQLFLHHEKPTSKKMYPVINNIGRDKPWRGGLWTSDFCPDKNSSAWFRFAQDNFEEPYPESWGDLSQGWLLEAKNKARVFTIDCFTDWVELTERYPRRRPAFAIADFEEPKNGNFIDFSLLQDDYDGLYLSELGCQNVNGLVGLHGWACPSTFWMKWVFKEPQHVLLS